MPSKPLPHYGLYRFKPLSSAWGFAFARYFSAIMIFDLKHHFEGLHGLGAESKGDYPEQVFYPLY
jgi:hypothetical protein